MENLLDWKSDDYLTMKLLMNRTPTGQISWMEYEKFIPPHNVNLGIRCPSQEIHIHHIHHIHQAVKYIELPKAILQWNLDLALPVCFFLYQYILNTNNKTCKDS